MHWCGDEFRIMAMVLGHCDFQCARRALRAKLYRLECWYEDHTELQKRDMIYFGLWAVTVVVLGVL